MSHTVKAIFLVIITHRISIVQCSFPFSGDKCWESKVKHELQHFDPPPADATSAHDDSRNLETRETDFGTVRQLSKEEPLLKDFVEDGPGISEVTKFHKCRECGKTIYGINK